MKKCHKSIKQIYKAAKIVKVALDVLKSLVEFFG